MRYYLCTRILCPRIKSYRHLFGHRMCLGAYRRILWPTLVCCAPNFVMPGPVRGHLFRFRRPLRCALGFRFRRREKCAWPENPPAPLRLVPSIVDKRHQPLAEAVRGSLRDSRPERRGLGQCSSIKFWGGAPGSIMEARAADEFADDGGRGDVADVDRGHGDDAADEAQQAMGFCVG